MARFLFTVWPFAGHLHPSIAIAHGLQARGHDISFYTGSAVRSIVEEEGFTFFPFKKLDEQRTTALASSEFPYTPSLWKRIRTGRLQGIKFREWLVDTIPQQVEDIDEVSAQWHPDVLLCDLAFWSPILVLREARKIPVGVLSVLAACALPGPDAPCWGLGWPKPRTALMRFRSRFFGTVGRWVRSGFLKNVNSVRKNYGLPALRYPVTEFAGQMPVYLVTSTREYDYNRHDLPPNVQYVGPCLWDNPGRSPAPDWLQQLPTDRPLIYATEATIGTNEPFLLKTTALACKDLPVQVVMTTGKQRRPEDLDLGALAPNVRVESYVPQSDLMPKTSVMVTVGGSGGVLAALKAGVPLVVVPTEWDRPENAQRVVEAGAGLRIAPSHCTPERLRAAIQRLLSEPSFRKNAQRLADACARYGGPALAAECLESLLPSRERVVQIQHIMAQALVRAAFTLV
jgi:MGT family glycosyltransferase